MITTDELKKEINIKENSLKMYNKTRMDMLLRGADKEDCSEIEHQIEMLRNEIDTLKNISEFKDIKLVDDISTEKITSNFFKVKFPKEINIDQDCIKSLDYDNVFNQISISVVDYVKRKNGYIEILGREIEKCINMPFDFDIEWYDKRGSLAYIEHYTGCKITNYYGNKCTADSTKEREFNITIGYEKLEYKAPVLEINKKSSNFDFLDKIKLPDNISISTKDYPDPFKTRIYW
jgi:hypothetical protein